VSTCASDFAIHVVGQTCPSLNTGGTITNADPISPYDGPPWHYIVFPVQMFTGVAMNIYITQWSGNAFSGQFNFVDPFNNVLVGPQNFSTNTVFRVTPPADGIYSLVFEAFDPAIDGNGTVAFFTDCEDADIPCVLPGGLPARIRIQGYVDGIFDLSACASAASVLPVWDGTMPDYLGGGDWEADGVNFPSNFSIQGKRLAEAFVVYQACSPAGPATWTLFIELGDTFDSEPWVGVLLTGNTPAGVYRRLSGCSPGPATITVEAY